MVVSEEIVSIATDSRGEIELGEFFSDTPAPHRSDNDEKWNMQDVAKISYSDLNTLESSPSLFSPIPFILDEKINVLPPLRRRFQTKVLSSSSKLSSKKIEDLFVPKSPTSSCKSPLSIVSISPLNTSTNVDVELSSAPDHATNSFPELDNPIKTNVWVKHFSTRQQRDYWFNTTSGISVWEEPTL